jgi:TPR repeat protein
MRNLVRSIVLLLALGLSEPVLAGPFEDAHAAYDNQDYATALRMLRPRADQGDASAQANLGLMYANGYGVPQDYVEAVKWYRLAADQGYAPAQINLGTMYKLGQGVPKDDAQAVKWYRLAADQGDAWAQSNLGFMYEFGRGVPKDYALAYMWLNLAAAGAPDSYTREQAAKARDDLATMMAPAQIAEAQRMSREWKPK